MEYRILMKLDADPDWMEFYCDSEPPALGQMGLELASNATWDEFSPVAVIAAHKFERNEYGYVRACDSKGRPWNGQQVLCGEAPPDVIVLNVER